MQVQSDDPFPAVDTVLEHCTKPVRTRLQRVVELYNIEAAGRDDDDEWRTRTEVEVHRLVAALQGSDGAGARAFEALRLRYACCRLLPADGWHVLDAVLTDDGQVTQSFDYYGGIDASTNQPCGLPAGETLKSRLAAGTQPTRTFSTWLQAHVFVKTGETLPVLSVGGKRGSSKCLTRTEMEALCDWMTPRIVTRNGVACPDEDVKTKKAADALGGTWRWEYTTRLDGLRTAGHVDRYYYLPTGGRRRALSEVAAWRATQQGQAPQTAGVAAGLAQSRAPKRKHSAAAGAPPSRPARRCKDAARPNYAELDGDDSE